jgi:hypothetical protein
MKADILKAFGEKFVGVGNWRETGFAVPYVKATAESLEAFISFVYDRGFEEGKKAMAKEILEDIRRLKGERFINIIKVLSNL